MRHGPFINLPIEHFVFHYAWSQAGTHFLDRAQASHIHQGIQSIDVTTWGHDLSDHGFLRCVITCYNIWLVVWTPLKNISQLGWLFPIYGKIKMATKPPTRCYNHLKPSYQIHPKTSTKIRSLKRSGCFRRQASDIPPRRSGRWCPAHRISRSALPCSSAHRRRWAAMARSNARRPWLTWHSFGNRKSTIFEGIGGWSRWSPWFSEFWMIISGSISGDSGHRWDPLVGFSEPTHDCRWHEKRCLGLEAADVWVTPKWFISENPIDMDRGIPLISGSHLGNVEIPSVNDVGSFCCCSLFISTWSIGTWSRKLVRFWAEKPSCRCAIENRLTNAAGKHLINIQKQVLLLYLWSPQAMKNTPQNTGWSGS